MNSSTTSAFHSGSSVFLYSLHTSGSVTRANTYSAWSSQVSLAVVLPGGSGLPSAVAKSALDAAPAHAASSALPSMLIGPAALRRVTAPGGGGALATSTSNFTATAALSRLGASLITGSRSSILCLPRG